MKGEYGSKSGKTYRRLSKGDQRRYVKRVKHGQVTPEQALREIAGKPGSYTKKPRGKVMR